VNALEQVLIPGLRNLQRRISLVLDEREREDHFRLGRAKRRRSARAAVPRSAA
jgi:V/A-type H+-transporting ATPase subunit D